MSQRRPSGYSYMEMILVISLIGILVALLLPAVQAAREAARRMRCATNLTQLIAAVHLYESHHEFWPPGTIDAQGPVMSLPVGYHHNWITQILPYVEQKVLYQHVNFQVGVYDPTHQPLRRRDVPLLQCPSSPIAVPGYSDYAGIHHDQEAPIDVTNHGVFFLNSRLRLDDLIDGSSHTLAMGEKWSIKGDLGWMSGTRATLRNTGSAINTTGGTAGVPPRAGNSAQPQHVPPLTGSDEQDRDVLPPDKELMDWIVGPSYPRASLPGEMMPVLAPRPTDIRLAVGGLTSVHPGGVQVASADGAVRFLSQTVAFGVLAALAHRHDGQLTDDDF
ncbi:MAG: DUF1559 domain-containing protein [Pirellulaceae bacterium]